MRLLITPLFMLALLLGYLAYPESAGAVRPRKPAPTITAPPGESNNPHLWRTRAKSVAVFKNGMGFFLREGEVSLRDGWCLSGPVPPALFGTLAIYSLAEQEAVDVVGSGPGETVEFDGTDEPTDDEVKRSRLQAAVDLQVELTYRQHDADRRAAGKLVSVAGDFAVLDNDSQSFAVPIAGLSRMQVLDLPLRIHVAHDSAALANAEATREDKPAAPDDEGKKTRLGMAYLRKGITWVPEYTLRIVNDNEAELSLRGTLVNEAEDLIHCDVQFVVGVPHFMHTEYLSPLAVGQVIRTVASAVAPTQVQSQIMNRAAITSNALSADQFATAEVRPVEADAGNVEAALGNLPKIAAPGASDYTVYTKPDLTLRRGEKAIVTLFTRRVRYSHGYRWTPPAPIEHHLLLANDSGTAWTTGPCLAVSGDHPLSEDLLRYTPQGGRGELAVTAAVNISHDRSEVEVERQLKAHSPADQVHFDLVTLEGTLKLRNFEPRAVEIELTIPVPGKPIKASGNGSLAADPTKLKLSERSGTVHWGLTLEPGQTKSLSYRYERYVPSN